MKCIHRVMHPVYDEHHRLFSFNPIYTLLDETNEDVEIEKYIINDGATIIFWDDDTKTISKRHKEDKFDKELGFLFAYFYKKWGDNKSAKKRLIDSIDYKKIKIFLFEFYCKDSGKTTEQAKKYLNNLKVEK